MQKVISIIIYILKKIRLIIITIISLIIYFFISDNKKEKIPKDISKKLDELNKEKKEIIDTTSFHENSNLSLNPKPQNLNLKELFLEIFNLKENELTENHLEILNKLEKNIHTSTYNLKYEKALDKIEEKIIEVMIEEPKYIVLINKDCSETFIRKIEKNKPFIIETLEHSALTKKENFPNKNIQSIFFEELQEIKIETPTSSSFDPNYSQKNINPKKNSNQNEYEINSKNINELSKSNNHAIFTSNKKLNIQNIKTRNNPSIKEKIEEPTIFTKIQEEKETNIDLESKSEPLEQDFKIEKIIEPSQINIIPFTDSLKNIEINLKKEQEKEDLEDKNYESLELEINKLLIKINYLKTINLQPNELSILANIELKVKTLENKINIQKEQDIIKEENLLNENITLEQINLLELQINKLYIENKEALNNNLLTKIEDLEKLDKTKSKTIEKNLLKDNLKNTAKIPFILKLPFIKNKYFSYFSYNLFVNNNFKIYNSILTRKSIVYNSSNIEHIKKGYKALNSSLNLVNENLEYLDYLKNITIKKHPELLYDKEFLKYLEKIRNNLNKNKKKLIKKKELIYKYSLNHKYKTLKRTKKYLN